MRIIGGTHRSRPILPPKERDATRPIIDRVKQSLFDRLWTMGLLGDSPADFGPSEMVGGGNVLDVFAGTGSLGLEALSRGADFCTFVEQNRWSRGLLDQNLEALGFAAQARVMQLDALAPAWLGTVSHRPFRVVFLDPPYALSAEPETLARVTGLMEALRPAMETGGALMLRTESRIFAPVVKGWTVPASHEYGSMSLHFYQPV